jgi:uncharacterized small protein (DUF1192 family)
MIQDATLAHITSLIKSSDKKVLIVGKDDTSNLPFRNSSKCILWNKDILSPISISKIPDGVGFIVFTRKTNASVVHRIDSIASADVRLFHMVQSIGKGKGNGMMLSTDNLNGDNGKVKFNLVRGSNGRVMAFVEKHMSTALSGDFNMKQEAERILAIAKGMNPQFDCSFNGVYNALRRKLGGRRDRLCKVGVPKAVASIQSAACVADNVGATTKSLNDLKDMLEVSVLEIGEILKRIALLEAENAVFREENAKLKKLEERYQRWVNAGR